LDITKPEDKIIIENSFKHLEEKGTKNWCGYSFAWMACLYARAHEADKAVKQLQIFASNFCSSNSFHLNGDQKGGQYSNFTYRPFTLEGNFAFAQGVQELLLQSRNDYVEVFPAVPSSWKNVSFNNLRTEGAFLISARKENGVAEEIKIVSEKGGVTKLKLPFKTMIIASQKNIEAKNTVDGFVKLICKPGGIIVLKNGYE
jgi:alpha-L-fucosidase 2